MKAETHFLLIFLVLSLYIVILYFISDCNDYIKVFNTKDPRVDNRPIWKCIDENDKTSRLTNIYNTEKHLQRNPVQTCSYLYYPQADNCKKILTAVSQTASKISRTMVIIMAPCHGSFGITPGLSSMPLIQFRILPEVQL